MSKKPDTDLPVVITLTLPESAGDSRDGALLIQRGDLAHVKRFTYTEIADLTGIIADALIALSAVEAAPPVLTEATPPPVTTRKTPLQQPPPEPTVDIPLRKGKKAVKISHLKLTGGETDAAAYRQAVQIASVLIDGKLWDGETLIRIDDVYALAKKMKYLTARDMQLFSLTDFVQVGAAETESVEGETGDMPAAEGEEDKLPTLAVPHNLPHSANGHHHASGASEQTALI